MRRKYKNVIICIANEITFSHSPRLNDQCYCQYSRFWINIIPIIYTNIVIIFYVEYYREYKFLYSIFQSFVLWRIHRTILEKIQHDKVYYKLFTFFPSLSCFYFGDFLTFFTWQPLFFFALRLVLLLPFFSSSHPELSFVQVSKRHPEKLETEFTTHRRGFEPESWHFSSQLR